MKIAHRAALRPSNTHRKLLAQHAGCARKAWNWGLGRKIEEREAGRKAPSAIDLHRELVRLKKIPVEDGGFPWMYESSKCAPQEALRDLDVAFKHFFRRCKDGLAKKGYPRFKARRRGEGGFRLSQEKGIVVTLTHIMLPRIGAIRIQPGCHGYIQPGRYSSASVVQEHGEWFVSVLSNVAEAAPVDITIAPRVGIDLGVRKLMTISTGEIVPNPKALNKARLRLARRQRALAKKVKGSQRRERARRAVAKVHQRVANVRKDAIHKATRSIVDRYPVVAIEDLSVRNMTKATHGKGRAAKAGLNRSVLDASFGEIRRQLDYKLKLRGGHLIVVPAPYTSQRCSVLRDGSPCGALTDCGSNETFTCSACGAILDRDVNAARNIFADSFRETSPPVGRRRKTLVEADVSREGACIVPQPREVLVKVPRKRVRQQG